MDGKKASLLSGGACLGILMGPIIMGQTMGSYPTSLLYLILVCVVSFSTFGLLAGAVSFSITRDITSTAPLARCPVGNHKNSDRYNVERILITYR